MTLQWWEKTVEYKFVMEVSQLDKQFLAPLDGNHERAGDAIFSTSNKWVLIEFKKDSISISTEKSKFGSNYKKAKDALAPSDSHHHIVYGKPTKEVPSQLELYSQTYFFGLGKSHPLNIKEILSSGINYKEFSDYLNKLVNYKEVAQGGGSENLTINNYFLITGINSDNQLVACISLTEFQRQFELKLNHGSNLSQDSGRSF